MPAFDVFNGDADGICALLQLRHAVPRDATLVTGVKRDIQLLSQVNVADGDSVTVLDVSLDKNRDDLQRVLAAGAKVFYCDHHFAGDIPDSPKLQTLINTAPDVCTAVLVNGHLLGAFELWAVVGAFGDNLADTARRLAKHQSLSADALTQLQNLGIYINYNGYGPSLEDLHFHPADLYRELFPWASPLDYVASGADSFRKLEQGYQDDMAAAAAVTPEYQADHAAAYLLPDAAWARRVSGVYSNDLANAHPERAHAVLTVRANGNYLVSVRAPLANKTGADELCRQFATGGGRAAAAGINDLPADELPGFIERFQQFFNRP